MKFNEMKYERPDYEQVKAEYTLLLDRLEKATEPESFKEIFFKLNEVKGHIETMSTLCFVRHSIDTRDPFYDAEQEYWDEYQPMYAVFDNRLAEICVKCPFRDRLYDSIPEPYFLMSEASLKVFSEELIPLFQQENKLVSEYSKLKASAQIEFDGKTYNLASISPLAEDIDPKVRKGAYDAKLSFYSEHEADFDRIYDELVRIRDEEARRLGFSSYTEMSYLRMYRFGYDRNMVANYRNIILTKITPLADMLVKEQARRLGTDTVSYYDSAMEFLDGNPKPQGSMEQLVKSAQKMYHEMSRQTGEFIDLMVENELWDLESKDGKQMGGYCTSIPDYGVPFIFANSNGTSGDVDTLTHEAGHAFQYYTSSKKIPVNDCQWPTMESAEIASMSMEFNAWPWMEGFFGDKADRYRYTHLAGAVKFLPYGVLVDHFQHEVYDHPDWTPAQRKECWRKLEKMYQPYKDYTGAPILEKGCWWYQQGHIFENPFYYIDYTLAQVCALQFWARNQEKDEKAWSDYMTLCSLGGTKTFIELVKSCSLKVPFEDGCLDSVTEKIKEYFDSVDDSRI